MRIATLSFASILSATVLSLASAGCSEASNESNVAPESRAPDNSTENVSGACEIAEGMVGAYTWRPNGSGAFGDYETLTLDANGTYAAKVDATLVDPNARCIAFPCTLAETGTWCTDAKSGPMGLQLRPTTGSMRTSTATLDHGVLQLVRPEKRSVLFKQMRRP